MGNLRIAIATVVMFVGVIGGAYAQQATPATDLCAGIDAYIEAQVEPIGAYWDFVGETMFPRDPFTISRLEWTAYAEIAEAAQAAIKALDPPPGIANWHQIQIELFGLESLFAREVVKKGITVAKPAYDAEKDRYFKDSVDELKRAFVTCPELTSYHDRVVVGATPVASPEA